MAKTMIASLRLARAVKLDMGEDKAPPAEFRIFAFGTFESTKGSFIFDKEAAQLVMDAQAAWGNECSMDYEHQALQDPPIKAPAAAWYTLALRDDGLWATGIKWTPGGAAHLTAGEYRYFSPAFMSDKDTKRITRLVNLALTNLPATLDMQPLVAASMVAVDKRSSRVALSMSFDVISDELRRAVELAYPAVYAWVVEIFDAMVVVSVSGRLYQLPYSFDGARAVIDPTQAVEVHRQYTPVASGAEGEMTMKNLLTVLALGATATETDGIAAVTALKASKDDADKRATDAVLEAAAAKTKAAASETQLLSLTGAKSPAEAQGVLLSWKQGSEQAVTLSAELTAARAELAKISTEKRAGEVTALVDAAVREGKIPPASKEFWLTTANKGPEGFEMLSGFLKTAPVLVNTTATEKKPPVGKEGQVVVTLTHAERDGLKKAGISEEDGLKQKQRRADKDATKVPAAV